MWIILLMLAGLAGLLALGALAALLWLGRTLNWAELDDDHTGLPTPAGRTWFGRLTAWAKPKHNLLTYRRDARGRFRKHRR